MASADPVHAKAERLYSRTSEYRIGSRIALDDLGTPHYTLVGLHLEGDVLPLYVSDDYVSGRDTQFGVLEHDELDESVLAAPDDPEKAHAARAWAAKNREYLTHYGHDDVLFDIPTSVEQLRRFIQFCKTDREWRVAEHAQRRAASRRAHAIAQIVWTDDNQSLAARVLGLNQSSVSRAVAAATSNAP